MGEGLGSKVTVRYSEELLSHQEFPLLLNNTIFKGTVLYLVRVPVAVKDNNSVSSLQVQPQTSCSSTQQEDKVIIGRIIKVLQQHATILSLSGSYKDKRTMLARLYCQ